MFIIYFIIFLIQYIYLNYIANYNNKNIIKTEYKYKLNNSITEHSATLYKTNKNVKKIILFLSGSYALEFHQYIAKIMYDLDKEYNDIIKNYELICYEKSNKTSFDIYDDIYNYISYLDEKLDKIEELVIIGFSAGGVVGSHILQRCKNMNFKKKLITYNTPFQVYENVKAFKQNLFMRFDMIMFWTVIGIYLNHYNYNDIKHHLTNKKWNSGIDEMAKTICDVHNCSFDDFYKMTSFNFDQTKDTKVYSIYSINDFIVNYKKSNHFINSNKDKINFFYKVIKKTTIGHCSDLTFSTDYLKDIITILIT